MKWKTLVKKLKKRGFDYYYPKQLTSSKERPHWFIHPYSKKNDVAVVNYFRIDLNGGSGPENVPNEYVEEYLDFNEKVRRWYDHK